jgi:phosphopantetheine adenylyltransferase
MNLSDISLDHILFFLLGFTIVISLISIIDRNKIKSKYNKIKNTQSFPKSEHDKIVKEKDEEISKILSRYDKLKKYLGLVNDKEYGILKHTLQYGKEGNKKDLVVQAGFKVSQRGRDKVRIDIDINDVRVNTGKHANLNSYKNIKDILDGWYDVNSTEITWVEPDDALKREINIDNLLN